jgi:hypothetical protein
MKSQKRRLGEKRQTSQPNFEVLWAPGKESWNTVSEASEAYYLPAKGELYNCIIS